MKKNLVFIHGALGASQQFDVISKLLSHSYSVYLYEIPGHGTRADENISFSIEEFASDFENYLNQFKNPVSVFGFSMGGYISLYLAKTNPNLFEKIITLGTKFNWSLQESFNETQKLNVEILEVKVPQYCQYLGSLHGESWKNVVEKTKELMMRLGETPLLNETTCKEIKTQTVLMLGELDNMVTINETEMIQKAIPNSRFQIINGFVHPLEKLNAKELSELIKSIVG